MWQQKVLAGARSGFVASLYVAGPVLFWVIAGRTGLLSMDAYSVGTLILGAVLFILAIPVSLLLRLDALFDSQPHISEVTKLLVATFCVMLNFVLWGVIRHWRRARRLSQKSGAGSAEA